MGNFDTNNISSYERGEESLLGSMKAEEKVLKTDVINDKIAQIENQDIDREKNEGLAKLKDYLSDAIKNRKIDKNRGNVQLSYNEHTKKFQFSSYGIVHEFDLLRNVDNNKGGFNINSNWNDLDYLNLNVLGTSKFMKVSTNGGYNCFDLLDEINSHVFLLQQSKSQLESPFSAEMPGSTKSGITINYGIKNTKRIALTSKYNYVGSDEGLANYCNTLRKTTYKC